MLRPPLLLHVHPTKLPPPVNVPWIAQIELSIEVSISMRIGGSVKLRSRRRVALDLFRRFQRGPLQLAI